jgi:hypothetical protein
VMYSGTSNYNGLQMQLNRRYTRGFQFGVAYTYSKSFDYANDDSSDVSLPRPYKQFNYAPSDFDQTHILTETISTTFPALAGISITTESSRPSSINGSYREPVVRTGRVKNLTVSFTSGTATITAGQSCPPDQS